MDHQRQLESLSNVVIGQLVPHSTAEVDYESLFSESGALALPNRNRTKVEMYERLILGKHAPPGTNLLQQGESLEGVRPSLEGK